MNTRINTLLLAALLGVVFTTKLQAQPTAFTYQGQLAENGMPANGIYDLKFELWQPKGSVGVITNTATTVSNGLFTVMLDFGWAPFTGADLWLEIGVVTNGGATFVTLSPRQFISSAPYAIQAATASVAEYVSGDVSADQLTSGTVPSDRLYGTYSNPLTLSNAFNTFNGTFSGDGSGLSGIHSLDAADGSPTDAVYVDNNGNVGVGTNNPASALHVVGTVTADGFDGSIAANQLTGTIAPANIAAGTITSAMLTTGSVTAVQLAAGAVGTEQLATGTVFNGSFIGDAGSLSNLNSTRLTGPLTVDPGALANIGHIDNGGDAYGVALAGNYAYLANRNDGLRIYDISDPANPVNIGHTNDGWTARDVAVSGGYAYLANWDDGLRVYDISDPANPTNVGHTNDGGIALGVAVSGNYAYLANYGDGLRVYDISDPANPVNVGHTNDVGNARGVAVSGNYAFLANENDGLRVYDISDPANPANVGHVDDNGGYAQGVAVSGNYAYLANTTDGLRVYDISNQANPVNIGHIDDGGSAQGVTVSGNYAYLANHTAGLWVYDISDPANPVNIGHANNGGTAYGVAVSGGHAFLANYDDGLRVYSIGLVSGPGFAGNGSGLTSLSASQLTSGTLPSARFSGTYSNALILGNASNSFNGTFAGDGSGLSGVHSLDAADGSPTDAVYVDNEGNVGVGTNNPASALHVAGTVTADGFNGPIAANQLTGTIAPANIAANTITTTMLAPGSVTPSELDPTIGIWTQTDTNIHWSGGNVGIGTSTPREKLEVEGGNIRIQGVDGYDAPGESAYLYLGGTPNYIKATRNFGMNLGVVGVPEAVTIRHNTGNVGIGTTNPVTALQVVGTVTAGAFDGPIAASQLTGTISSSQLAPGAAAENLAASGQAGVPSGGVILSTNDNDTNLADAGYVKLGRVRLDETWRQKANGVFGARSGHTAVWTGSEMIVWGGYDGNYLGSGGRYNLAANSWTTMSSTGRPVDRDRHTAVWTGSEMIIWGGNQWGYSLNDGGRYDPAANSWTAVNTTGAPGVRYDHTAVWTGSEMIVWGGTDGSPLSDGARYDPAANSWAAVNTTGAPAARTSHTAVWTGSEMIIWGATISGDGGRYDPVANSWTTVSTTGAPGVRFDHTAVWTGSEMIVWGGYYGSSHLNDGSRYDPVGNSWTAVTTTGAPSGRRSHTAVWTGNEMIVWGGGYHDGSWSYFDDGGCYDPAGDSWSAMGPTDTPAARYEHTAVWTGSEMIVWGGYGGSFFNDTFTYTPMRVFYLYQKL